MKLTQGIQDPNRNPFCNRFHVPVHSRLDEMQAFTQMAWLNEPAALDQSNSQHSRHWGTALAAAFALVLVVVFSAAYLSN